ncbi:MAG: hypothetical protein H6574_25210 [Lewinellaceae bacterium]|nr:hypothetical protein [Lewinellaceae bacterium]
MKKLISQPTFAHDSEQHEKAADTVAYAEDTLTTAIAHGAEHQHQEMHSTIVEAKWSDFPTLHPLLVHFPIVLLLLAFFTQLLALFVWKKEFSLLTGILLLGGFVGAYLVSTFFHLSRYSTCTTAMLNTRYGQAG